MSNFPNGRARACVMRVRSVSSTTAGPFASVATVADVRIGGELKKVHIVLFLATSTSTNRNHTTSPLLSRSTLRTKSLHQTLEIVAKGRKQ